MAVTLADRYTAAQDIIFQNRVAESAREAALAIYSEVNTTPGHAARAAYAVAVLNEQTNKHALFFAAACAAQGLDASSTDAQIDSGVAAAWNACAGA